MFLHSFRQNIFEETMIVIAVFKDFKLVLPKYILNKENILFFFILIYLCYQDCLKWTVCYMSRNC